MDSKAIENKSPLLLIYFVDPLVNSLKDDPRYDQFREVIFPKTRAKEVYKIKKALLNDREINKYRGRLNNYILEKKPYLDPELSIRTLATQIHIHPNQLSWLLNESIGKNFSEFVNHYRVEGKPLF